MGRYWQRSSSQVRDFRSHLLKVGNFPAGDGNVCPGFGKTQSCGPPDAP